MKKSIDILIATFCCTLAMSLLIGQPSETLAQNGGDNSQESLEEGNQQIPQEIQNRENQQQQQYLDNREEQLDQELQINKKDPNAPTVEELSAPPESQSPNLPQSPESEVEVKF